MADIPRPGAGRRRATEHASRRPSALTILSAAIPLLTVAALALVRPASEPDIERAAADRPLARSSIVCPAQLGSARQVSLGSSELASGDLDMRSPGTTPTGTVRDGVGRLATPGVLVATGEDELAPGLLATRSGGGAATACVHPRPEQWFTGVGAGPEHASTLLLTNPDLGPAVADVTVLGPDGPVDVPELRGVTVPGGSTRTYAFDEVVPMRGALAIRVVVTRGRLGAHVEDLLDPVGRDSAMREWLPGQAAPAERSYVVGVGGEARGGRVLTVANPGDDEVRLETRLVTETSEFVPAGSEELRIRPRSVLEVDLTRLLGSRVARGTRALLVEATGPVTAALRSTAGGDLSSAVAGALVEEAAGIALPRGSKRLVVAGASDPGVLRWRAWSADGEAIGTAERVEIDPGGAQRVSLPGGAALLVVELDRASAVVSVEIGPPGLAVVPLEELVLTSEVPHVRPALR